MWKANSYQTKASSQNNPKTPIRSSSSAPVCRSKIPISYNSLPRKFKGSDGSHALGSSIKRFSLVSKLSTSSLPDEVPEKNGTRIRITKSTSYPRKVTRDDTNISDEKVNSNKITDKIDTLGNGGIDKVVNKKVNTVSHKASDKPQCKSAQLKCFNSSLAHRNDGSLHKITPCKNVMKKAINPVIAAMWLEIGNAMGQKVDRIRQYKELDTMMEMNTVEQVIN